jgi:hypothetical protein
MGLSSLFGPILKQVLGSSGGALQQPGVISKSNSNAALSQVNPAAQATPPQELTQLHAADRIETAAITPEVIKDAAPFAATNHQEIKHPAIKLEFSEEAVKSLKPILSALKDLVRSVLPGLNLQQLAATAKPMLQALSQVSSNSADTLAAPNPA